MGLVKKKNRNVYNSSNRSVAQVQKIETRNIHMHTDNR